MSTERQRGKDDDETGAMQQLRDDHPQKLEKLADSDLPAAPIAERILEVTDDD